MNRQKGVWITILCILVIGVSVTKMTRSFISSGTLETVAFEAGAGEPAEETRMAPAEMAAPGPSAAGGTAAKRAAAQNGGNAVKNDRVAVPDTENGGAADAAGSAETKAASDSGPGPAGAVPEMAAAEAAKTLPDGEETAGGVPQAAMFQAAPEDGTVPGEAGEESAAEDKAAVPDENTAVQETVKSPLDPAAPGLRPTVTETGKETAPAANTAEEYRKRLDQTDSQIVQYRGTTNDSSATALYMAAEYAWGLWDNELNTLYSILRSKMSSEEVESLKQEELEWIKERDAASEKAASKANSQVARNTAYLEAASKETRSRCYELLDEYGDVLERE